MRNLFVYYIFAPIHIEEKSRVGEMRWRRRGDVEERAEGRGGAREEKQVGGGSECANSRFLIKQQCSQLIHLIRQLGEKHGRNLFT